MDSQMQKLIELDRQAIHYTCAADAEALRLFMAGEDLSVVNDTEIHRLEQAIAYQTAAQRVNEEVKAEIAEVNKDDSPMFLAVALLVYDANMDTLQTVAEFLDEQDEDEGDWITVYDGEDWHELESPEFEYQDDRPADDDDDGYFGREPNRLNWSFGESPTPAVSTHTGETEVSWYLC